MDGDIYACFRQVAARDPSATAIRGLRRCTYGELDLHARRVAARLRRSIPSDAAAVVVLVGNDVIAEIAAILGVLAAGGVAVPVEATDPPARLARLIDACQPSAILSLRASLPLAAAIAPGVAAFEVPAHEPDEPDEPDELDEAVKEEAPGAIATHPPDAPAYLCFTSGTTGEPKGVVATHRKTIAQARAGADALGHGPDDRHTLLHSLGLGSGRATLFRALLSGGAVLPRRVGEEGVANLRRWLETEGATVLFCSPTLYRTFLGTLDPLDPITILRVVRLVGERVLPDDLAAFKRHFARGTRFVNAYSITEVGNVTLNVLTHDSPVPRDVLAVGYPLSGRRVRIVDERGEEVPPGVTGEIAVETNDDSNAGSLAQPGPHVFMTGDLGRMDPDGCLYHLGRRDFQVKIRGFRVELEGVEATLLRAPGVSQAAVIVRANAQREATLVAYAAGNRQLIDPERLRSFAASQLPAGSVPSRFVVLEALPLTASGKVDRRAIATLDDSEPATGPPPDSPTGSAVEQGVRGIWHEVLGHDHFGPDDHFLGAGGDSLLAMRVLGRVGQQFGVDIPLTDFLASPSIAALAAAIDRDRVRNQESREGLPDRSGRFVLTRVAGGSRPADRRPVLVIMPSMFGTVVEWHDLLRHDDVDRPVYGLELLGDAAYWKPAPTMEEIAAACLDVLQRDLPDRALHLVGYSFSGRLAYEVGQQLSALGRPPVSVVIVDTSGRNSVRRRVRWRDLRSMVTNAPAWLRNELSVYGPRALRQRVAVRLPFRVGINGGGLERMFDLSRFSDEFRARLTDGYRAFCLYQPRPTCNRVSYLRCGVRPLFHVDQPDGGWEQLVPATRLRVLQIPGDHGSALHARWRPSVRSAVQRALDETDREADAR
jgi:acyl-CoA synthetase (AMP-forming)/AMP-acid ligase II/thioesterase domain-containing protein/acyl carrier protein